MKNLVVFYNGREGSSAIVSSLSNHSNVSLPVFEHLDYVNFKGQFGVEGVEKLHKAMENILKGYAFDDNILKEKDFDCDNDSSVVFKWRPCGDLEKISSVFLENKVSIALLSRRDLVNHALSKYFTNRVLSESGKVFHPQFHVNKLSESEQKKYIDNVRSKKFEVSLPEFIEECEIYINSKKNLLEKALVFSGRGVPVKFFFYEDFLDNKDKFLRNLLSIIDLGFEDTVSESGFKKVNRDDIRQQVLNIEEVEKNPMVLEIVKQYRNMFLQYETGSLVNPDQS